jgi:hypothetical protein
MPTGTLTLRSDLERKLTIAEMDNNLIFLSSSYTYREDILDSTGSYVINHNLNESYPLVQVWETGSGVIIPESIISDDANTISLNFAGGFNGHVIVKV